MDDRIIFHPRVPSCPPLVQGKYRAAEVELSAPGEQAEISAIQKRTGHPLGGEIVGNSGGPAKNPPSTYTG